MFTADSGSILICQPLHQAVSSFQRNVVKWQVTKKMLQGFGQHTTKGTQ